MSSCIKTSSDSSKSEVCRSMIAFSFKEGFGLIERDVRKDEIGFVCSNRFIGNMDGWG